MTNILSIDGYSTNSSDGENKVNKNKKVKDYDENGIASDKSTYSSIDNISNLANKIIAEDENKSALTNTRSSLKNAFPATGNTDTANTARSSSPVEEIKPAGKTETDSAKNADISNFSESESAVTEPVFIYDSVKSNHANISADFVPDATSSVTPDNLAGTTIPDMAAVNTNSNDIVSATEVLSGSEVNNNTAQSGASDATVTPEKTEPASTSVSDIINGIKNLLSGLDGSFLSNLKALLSNAVNIIKPVKDFIGNISEKLKGILDGGIFKLPAKILEFFKSDFSKILELPKNILKFISDKLKPVLDGSILKLPSKIIEFVKSNFDKLFELPKKLISSVTEKIKSVFDGGILKLPTKIIDIVKSAFGKVLELPKTIVKFISDIPKSIGSISDKTSGLISKVIGNIENNIKTIADSMANTAHNITSALLKGTVGNFNEFVSTIGGSIDNVIKSLFGNIGTFFSSLHETVFNVIKGMGESTSFITTGIKNFFDNMTESATTNVGKIANLISDIVTKVTTGIDSIVNSTSNGFSKFVEGINSVVNSFSDGFGKLTGGIDGLVNTLSNAFTKIITGTQSVIDVISKGVKTFDDVMKVVAGTIETVKDIPIIGTSITLIDDAIKGLFKLANPIEGIKKIIDMVKELLPLIKPFLPGGKSSAPMEKAAIEEKHHDNEMVKSFAEKAAFGETHEDTLLGKLLADKAVQDKSAMPDLTETTADHVSSADNAMPDMLSDSDLVIDNGHISTELLGPAEQVAFSSVSAETDVTEVSHSDLINNLFNQDNQHFALVA
ncbi:hypothetical protein AC068_04975 [Morganella morganii]|uniref:phage tail protein n=1 Tax=Morganella morganii TaxID=582 RepID=UPI0006C34F48|nr:hypothetical protein [Morganella morganii]KOO19828.1 hypothetical protein AC068_04975 [Morganella morganii]